MKPIVSRSLGGVFAPQTREGMKIGETIPMALATRMKSRLLICLSVFMSVPSVSLINRNSHYPIPAGPQYTPDRP
jgi:hypothetical protein